MSSVERQHPRFAHDVAIKVHFTKPVVNVANANGAKSPASANANGANGANAAKGPNGASAANGQLKKFVIEGRTNNVSRGGLSANVSDEVPLGADIEVDITLVFDDGMQSEALRLPARVAWCTSIEDAYQIGISFKPMTAERAEYLQLFLKYLGEERAAKQPRTKTLDIDKRFG